MGESILDLDGMAQADLVRRGEITAGELLELTIGAIERVNPRLNAVITPLFDLARATARSGRTEGPFGGVPFLLKDHLATLAGVRLTNGSRLYARHAPAADSELVRRYKRAGFVTAGKTNLSEFAILPTTEPVAFGPTRNPWNLAHSCGGSSGGSAAAVAARLVPIAYGNDVGGSIRIPASCCGLFGLKPSRGRNPSGPVFTEPFCGFVGEHVLTRSVRDSAAVLDATAGPEPGDPYAAPQTEGTFLGALARRPGRLRIGFSDRSPWAAPVHPDCQRALVSAVGLCEELGHEVREFALPFDEDIAAFRQSYLSVMAVGCSLSIRAFERAAGTEVGEGQVEPLSLELFRRARSTSAPDYELAKLHLQRVCRDVGRAFEDIDVWLSPTLPEPPVPLGTFGESSGSAADAIDRVLGYVSFVMAFNLTGQPAASVPMLWNDAELPIGVQIVSKLGGEATLLQLAAQIEAGRPWAGRKPAVSA